MYRYISNNTPLGWEEFFNIPDVKEILKNTEDKLNRREDVCVPDINRRFTWARLLKPKDIKVVIIGMDPYFTSNTACGLSFSTYQNKTPSSLKNIFKQMEKTVRHFKKPKNNDLTWWATQGVLLYNTALTVKLKTDKSTAGAHLDIWLPFTKYLIKYLCDKYSGLIFVLWGGKAQQLTNLINDRHTTLLCNHPSGLSIANSDPDKNPSHFFNCNHFNECNTILREYGLKPINWVFPFTPIEHNCNIMFFDIETTGLSPTKHDITTIVWLYNGKLKRYINSSDYENTEKEFIKDWNESEMLVSFNGINFDEKFIINKFKTTKHSNHLDLKKEWQTTMGVKKGNLKIVAKYYNSYRPNKIKDISGADAPLFWKSFINSHNTNKLKQLLFYNCWDVIDTYNLYCSMNLLKPHDYTNQIDSLCEL